MRITNSMVSRNLMYNLNRSASRMLGLQDQLSSGKAIGRPSDDPVATASALRLRTAINELGRYKENIERTRDWLEATGDALRHIGECLTRCKELAVAGATDTMPQASRDALAAEIDEIYGHLVQLGNTQHAGRYIFAGQNTLTQPFGGGGPLDTGPIVVEIAPGVTMQVNITGAFLGPGGLLGRVQQLAADLRAGNLAGVQQYLSDGEADLDTVLSLEAEVGAKINRLEMVMNRADNAEISMTKLLSDLEDADLAQLAVKLSEEEASYRAALAVGARIIQPTLADFLR